MREVTRRLFLRRSAGVAGGAAIVGAPTVLAETASARGTDSARVLRRLVRSPRFTIVAVLSLAAAVGANAAVFGVLNGNAQCRLKGVCLAGSFDRLHSCLNR